MKLRMKKMNNYAELKNIINKYLQLNNIAFCFSCSLTDASFNEAGNIYVYDKEKKDIEVIDMDLVAKDGYRKIKSTNTKENPINTADAFVISADNEWYFIEFKDRKLAGGKNGLKDNILKKAYSNWYMLLDILYFMRENSISCSLFNFDNPARFAKEHVHYILVCSSEKNPDMYRLIKECKLSNQNYTPPFMQRLKDYIFKDAYLYTEYHLERNLIDNFLY